MAWLNFLLALLGPALTTSGLAGSGGPPGIAQTIAAAKWKQRVVLVTAPTPSVRYPSYAQQKQLLAAAATGLREREVLVLYRLGGEMSPQEEAYLHQRYGLQVKGFEVVLIGKDGGVKLHRTQPVAPAELFGLIDQMPMRRDEMRRPH